MLIALDYDDTFTRDPEAWVMAMKSLKVAGHEIVGATMRYPHEATGMASEYGDLCSRIVFTGRAAKRQHLAERGIYPDVWIDDRPEFILHSAAS